MASPELIYLLYGVGIPGMLLLLILCISWICYRRRKRNKKRKMDETNNVKKWMAGMQNPAFIIPDDPMGNKLQMTSQYPTMRQEFQTPNPLTPQQYHGQFSTLPNPMQRLYVPRYNSVPATPRPPRYQKNEGAAARRQPSLRSLRNTPTYQNNTLRSSYSNVYDRQRNYDQLSLAHISNRNYDQLSLAHISNTRRIVGQEPKGAPTDEWNWKPVSGHVDSRRESNWKRLSNPSSPRSPTTPTSPVSRPVAHVHRNSALEHRESLKSKESQTRVFNFGTENGDYEHIDFPGDNQPITFQSTDFPTDLQPVKSRHDSYEASSPDEITAEVFYAEVPRRRHPSTQMNPHSSKIHVPPAPDYPMDDNTLSKDVKQTSKGGDAASLDESLSIKSFSMFENRVNASQNVSTSQQKTNKGKQPANGKIGGYTKTSDKIPSSLNDINWDVVS